LAGGAGELAARDGGEVDLDRFGVGADEAVVAEEGVVELDPDPSLILTGRSIAVPCWFRRFSVLSWIAEGGAASSSVASRRSGLGDPFVEPFLKPFAATGMGP
jgi:hypothetical protein